MNRGARELRGHVDLGAGKGTLDHEKGDERVLVCREENLEQRLGERPTQETCGQMERKRRVLLPTASPRSWCQQDHVW